VETALPSPTSIYPGENAAPASTGVCRSAKQRDWQPEEEAQPAQILTAFPPSPQPSALRRKRLTVYLPVTLLERLRNTVFWTRGATVAGLLEAALRESLDQRERLRGGPFPRRLAELKGGRPRRRQPDPLPEG
jgi:hypothetical protein